MRATRLLGGGAALLAVLIVLAVAGPALAPYDPASQVSPPFSPPGAGHVLGTDDVGHDILSQLLAGARASLLVGTMAATTAMLVGVTVGLTAGLSGGAADFVLMRLVDVMLTLPFLPLAIVVSVFAGPGIGTEIAVIGLVLWARTARVLRAQVLAIRGQEYVVGARAIGAGTPRVLARHVLPSALPLVVPELVRAASAAILLESSLSFLGLGDPTVASWGTMLFYANARSAFLTDAWVWWVLPPGLCIGLTVLAFALIGFAAEERAWPQRGGWVRTPASRR
ncbi:MAG: ABC transporter permease [Gemmatimonadaceae bacterium]